MPNNSTVLCIIARTSETRHTRHLHSPDKIPEVDLTRPKMKSHSKGLDVHLIASFMLRCYSAELPSALCPGIRGCIDPLGLIHQKWLILLTSKKASAEDDGKVMVYLR